MRAWMARPAYALALSLLVAGPLLGPGYLLLRDAVSTPRSYLSDTALGLTAAPRATPQDFAVALASHVLDGGVVVKALLVLGLWLAGWGAARLVAAVLPEASGGGEFVATTVAIWNPYVAERLLQGHWSLLVGYGCLPWVATAMVGLRCGDAGFCGLAFWIALAGLTPTGLILAATVALVCVAAPGNGRPRWLSAVAALGCSVVGALPWLVASLAGSSLRVGNEAGVDVFAPRAEPGLGTLLSLAGLGGIWNGDAVPTSRTTLFVVAAATVLLGVVAVGLPVAVRRPAARPLLLLSVAAVVLPALLATGPGLHVLRAAVDAVPGLGVLRDGQKWVALAVPGYCLAAAGAVVTLRRWLPSTVTAVVCCLVLVLVLPDLAWGAWGRVAPVRYPQGWTAVRARINAEPGAVAVLPTGTMRRFSWSGPAPVLDPLPRWVRADVLSTGDLVISGVTVPGEGDHARAVQQLLLSGQEPSKLAAAGLAWLVVESGSPGDMGFSPRTVSSLTPAYRDNDIALYRIGGRSAGAPASHRRWVLLAHFAWLALLAAGGTGLALRTVADRRARVPGANHQ
ncbi:MULTISPECIES: hypothetical protein [unclassified Mycobacterium]|uniref:hypothetical protein n=2 Tax=Mycobacterium TaxID=1763 RepID=UPI0027426994|nr:MULTISPECIES: hypothetical protein [unclassified Mycobacterium]MDP7704407.1 hypothetical protein [Mycobacterium sp. TY815]MDP7722876.1 hypothetical protein [Mycobacterium sp. TY814]